MKKNRLIRFPGLLKRFRKNLMFIKCCIVFIFVFSLNLSAHVFSQSKLVTLDLKEVSVEKFVDAVKQQTGMKMSIIPVWCGKLVRFPFRLKTKN